MKIEEGKFYRTRGNHKVGPIREGCRNSDNWFWRTDTPASINSLMCAWRQDGSFYEGETHDMDLVAEWTDEPTGPVRTITRKEIVPGTYSKVHVGARDNEWLPIGITIDSSFNADELRAAAATLTEIADALGEAP